MITINAHFENMMNRDDDLSKNANKIDNSAEKVVWILVISGRLYDNFGLKSNNQIPQKAAILSYFWKIGGIYWKKYTLTHRSFLLHRVFALERRHVLPEVRQSARDHRKAAFYKTFPSICDWSTFFETFSLNRPHCLEKLFCAVNVTHSFSEHFKKSHPF